MARRAAKRKGAGFYRGGNGLKGTTYTCRGCGKLTRDTGNDEGGCGVCIDCYEQGGLDNAHSDGHHDETPDGNCKRCREAAGTTLEAPRAIVAPQPARYDASGFPTDPAEREAVIRQAQCDCGGEGCDKCCTPPTPRQHPKLAAREDRTSNLTAAARRIVKAVEDAYAAAEGEGTYDREALIRKVAVMIADGSA